MRLSGRLACSLPFLLLLVTSCAQDQRAVREDALREVMETNRANLAALEGTTAPRGMASSPATATGPIIAPRRAVDMEGAQAQSVIGWLGKPQLRRSEGDAEIWRYQGAACHLDMVFYRDAQGLRVGQASARAAGVERMTEGDCLQTLALAARR